HVELPAAEFLRHAESLFRLAPVMSARLSEAGWLLGALGQCPQLARLRELDFGHADFELSAFGRLVSSTHFPALEGLGARGPSLCSPGGFELRARCGRLAGLKRLDLGDRRRDPMRGRRGFVGANWRRIEAWGRLPGNARITPAALRLLLASPVLGELEELTLA